MAKQTRKRKSGSRGNSSSGNTQTSQRSGGNGNALRSMFLGMVIFGVLVLIFLVPIGGKTPFNHFLDLFPKSEEGEAQKPAKNAKAEQTAPKIQVQQGKAAPSAPVQVKLSPKAAQAAPLEDLSEQDQEGLDRLIQEKTAQ